MANCYYPTLILNKYIINIIVNSVSVYAIETTFGHKSEQKSVNKNPASETLNLLNGPILNPTQNQQINQDFLSDDNNLIRVRKENTNNLIGENRYLLYPQQQEYIGESVIKGIVSKWNSWFHTNSSTDRQQSDDESTNSVTSESTNSVTTERSKTPVANAVSTEACDTQNQTNSFSEMDVLGNTYFTSKG